MKSVYLAGRIDNRKLLEAITWRENAERLLLVGGVNTYNPLRGCYKMTGAYPLEYRAYGNIDYDFLYRRDLLDIDNSDIVLVNLDKVQQGAGTLFEIGYASSKGKALYAFNGTDSLREHMFITNSCKILSFSDCIIEIVNQYGNGVV